MSWVAPAGRGIVHSGARAIGRTCMCGIAGELRYTGLPDVAAVARITAAMAPRGPDGSGLHAAGSIALGHRRLKIIDLSERGAQPIVDSELGLSAVFNGCI